MHNITGRSLLYSMQVLNLVIYFIGGERFVATLRVNKTQIYMLIREDRFLLDQED